MRMLGLLAASAFVLGISSAQAADIYTLDPTHTNVVWKVDHFGFSSPDGKFANVEGKVTLDETAPEKSKVEVKIPTSSVLTGIPKFDEHLKSKDFFNVAQYPAATFTSTKVEKTGDKTAKVTGDFTLLGVTKPVVLDVTLNKVGENMMKKPTAGFSATTTIKRSEFGMNYGLPGVADDVKIAIEAEANR